MRLGNPLDFIIVDRKRLWAEFAADEAGPLHAAKARNRAADAFIRRLLRGVRRLAPNLPELNTADFRRSISEAETRLDEAETASALEEVAEDVSGQVESYAHRQKQLLADREEELRRILAMVSESLEQSRTGSREFIGAVEQSADDIEEVAKLEDLRSLRAGLARNLEKLRAATARATAAADPLAETLREVEELRRRLQQVEEAVLRDPLTGAYNRRAFDDRLQQMLDAEQPFILVLCDLDGFKQVNDTYGHAVGDKFLRGAATQLRAVFRPTDLVTRIGGDEFAILVAGLGGSQAAARLNSVFPPKAAPARNTELSLTFGIAEREADDSSQSLFERADRRLYAAKRSCQRVVYQGA